MRVPEQQRAVRHYVIDVGRAIHIVCVGTATACLEKWIAADGRTRAYRRTAASGERASLLDQTLICVPS